MTQSAPAPRPYFCTVPRLFVLGVAAILSLAACGSSDTVDSATAVTATSNGAPTTSLAADTTTSSRVAPPPGTVEIVDFDFAPTEITIARGETVTWRNEDPYAHWVVSTDADVLDTGELSQAQTHSETFSQTGTVDYYCNIHNYMKGTVTVG